MSSTIILYDIPSKVSTWSPNVWKTILSLHYKRLPYKVEWVEYPDIEATAGKLGVGPTTQKADGRPHFTLPVIHDPSTGAYVADSFKIAEYLDKTYPNTPRLLPSGSTVVHHAFQNEFRHLLPAIYRFALPGTLPLLNPPSHEYFLRTKFATMPSVAPAGSARAVEWENVKKEFGQLAEWLDKGEKDGPYILGATISFHDFTVGGYLRWFKLIFGPDSSEWKDITSWHGGKLGVLYEKLAAFESIVS